MLKESAIKKIQIRAKKVDRKVDIQDRDHHGNGRNKIYVRFEGSDQLLSFWVHGDGEISAPHTVRDGLESDPHTDYFPGTFWDNLTQALNYIAPLAPKYSVGSLVRFKDNKRNNRWKLAGKVALITQAEAGGNYKLQYNGSADRYNPFYSERDLELVS
mgnify:CR=1 FL=1|tara:strand:- start:212 stop:685 length:474 start_codon:yes stop_codon:yes gene_type:complete